MRTVQLLFLVGLVSFIIPVYAQTIIKGQVKSADGQTIPGATLRFKNSHQGASTDSLGKYEFTTGIQKAWLFCSAIGYHTDSLNYTGDNLALDFRLIEIKNDLSGVNIRIRRRDPEIKREYTLNDFDIATTAGASADIAGALQTFPGAAPAGNETGLFVHGGAARETQAFLDGMLVKNPFGSHLPDVANRSRFSAFLFDKTSFSTGGYPVQYGQALSSVLNMETKGLANTTSTEFSVISLGVGAAHAQRFKNSSLVVGGNYYNFGLTNRFVPQNINWKQDPQQYQGMFNYKWKTSGTGMFKFFTDYSDTRLSFLINNPVSAQQDLLVNRNRNTYSNANYQDYIAAGWKLFAGLAYNHTLEEGLLNQDTYHQMDELWQQKVTVSKIFKDRLGFTIGAEQFQSKRTEGYGALQRSYKDVLSAGFSEGEIYFNDLFVLKGGIRAEYTAYMNKANIAPRTSFTFIANPKSQFVAGYGIYYQKPDDSFLAQTAALDNERADNYFVDYEFTARSRNLRIEAYYKNYQDLVKITTPVYSGFQAYGPPLVISDFNNNGNGYARGIDIFWRDQATLPGGEYYVSYSYTDTRRNYIDYPEEGSPSFVPQHTFNLVARKYITRFRTQVSGTYTFSSGRPYFNPLNPVFMGNRAAASHNLSLGFSYIPNWVKEFGIFNLSITNMLGFKQVYGYRYADDGSRREPVLPPAKRGFLLSFLINIGDGTFNH